MRREVDRLSFDLPFGAVWVHARDPLTERTMTNALSTLELTLRPATNRGVRSLVVEVLVAVLAAVLLLALVLAQGAWPPF